MVLNILKRHKKGNEEKDKDKTDKKIKFLDFEIRFNDRNNIILNGQDERIHSTR